VEKKLASLKSGEDPYDAVKFDLIFHYRSYDSVSFCYINLNTNINTSSSYQNA
jgi:hypothetical protein